MNLLPDFIFEGRAFSMQDPYTLNGRIIVNIDNWRDNTTLSYHSDDDMLFITNDATGSNFNYLINKHAFLDSLQSFIESNNYFEDDVYIDECGHRIRSLPSNALKWLNMVEDQCRATERRNYWGEQFYLKKLYRELFAQGRNRDDEEVVICTNAASYSYTGRRQEINPFSDYADYRTIVATLDEPSQNLTTLTTNAIRDATINIDVPAPGIEACERHYTGQHTKDYIHGWNYKPEFIHYKLDSENAPLLLGAEIEVAGNTDKDEKTNRNDVVKKCIQIINNSDSDSEKLIYSTSDSTVQIELDTMPCSLAYHKTMNYRDMFMYLDEIGYKGHDCNNAGLHIHADRRYLGDTELKQHLVISKILYVLEKFNDEICMIARRGNQYSKFVGNGKDEKSVIELYGKYKDKGKHVALNLSHKDTIEFRCFKSTLKYETFILTLEFVQKIIDFCKQINIEEIETVTWNNLMETFSQELQDYYHERVEKQKNKQEETKTSVKIDRITDISFSIDDVTGRTAYGRDFISPYDNVNTYITW